MVSKTFNVVPLRGVVHSDAAIQPSKPNLKYPTYFRFPRDRTRNTEPASEPPPIDFTLKKLTIKAVHIV